MVAFNTIEPFKITTENLLMKLAILQFDPTKGSFENNISKAQNSILAITKVDLILLPELWAVGFMSFENFKLSAQKINGPLVTSMQQLAKEKNTDIFMGSFVEECDGKYYNTAVYIDKHGEMISTYRKIHLFTYRSKEAEILTAGTKASVFDSNFGPIAIATCYDLRFPEMFRYLQASGANLFIVPAAWPHKRIAHFRLFCQSRAVENLTFLVAANCCGGDDNKQLGGHSMVIDPFGEIITEGSDYETVLYTEIDLQKVDYWRNNFSALADKKPTPFWNN